MKAIICKYCGKESEAERSTKQFCSDTCRVAYNDLKGRVKELKKDAEKAMQSMMYIGNEWPEFSELVAGEMKKLLNYADSVFRKGNNKALEAAKQKTLPMPDRK